MEFPGMRHDTGRACNGTRSELSARRRRTFIMTAFCFAMIAQLSGRVAAQNEQVLYSFGGSDGANPAGGVTQDKYGNLYGTTTYGGASSYGTVYMVSPSLNETVLYSFANGTDGANPWSGLVRDEQGNLYGGTMGTEGNTSPSYASVFKLSPSRTLTVLQEMDSSQYVFPIGNLLLDAQGSLYGATLYGGSYEQGSIFKISASGVTSTLHDFSNGNGAEPTGSLVQGANGSLYGATGYGGRFGNGTVFIMDPSNGTQKVLYSFSGVKNDGANPASGVITDGSGNYYGTTLYGGAQNNGTVFMLTPAGVEHTLFSFSDKVGYYPAGNLIFDAKRGVFYGTTVRGGASDAGMVFSISPKGDFRVLHSFTGGSDGGRPFAGVIEDRNGNLYGTTFYGGAYGLGTIFKIIP